MKHEIGWHYGYVTCSCGWAWDVRRKDGSVPYQAMDVALGQYLHGGHVKAEEWEPGCANPHYTMTRAEQARNEALEEAARECEEFAAYYAPEFMAAPFPEGYVFKPEETRAAMHFAHGRFKACASKLREMIGSRSTGLEREDGR